MAAQLMQNKVVWTCTH